MLGYINLWLGTAVSIQRQLAISKVGDYLTAITIISLLRYLIKPNNPYRPNNTNHPRGKSVSGCRVIPFNHLLGVRPFRWRDITYSYLTHCSLSWTGLVLTQAILGLATHHVASHTDNLLGSLFSSSVQAVHHCSFSQFSSLQSFRVALS